MDTETSYPSNADQDDSQPLIPDLLKYRSEITPDNNSYIFLRDGENDEDIVTWKQLYDESLKVAAQLQRQKTKGERVILFFPPGTAFIKALYGCFLSNAIAVPAYPPRKNRSLDRIKALVNDSGAKFILSTTEIFNSCERSFSDVTELKDQAWILTDTIEPEVAGFHEIKIKADDIALLQYTSGSTGMPKGVMVTHINIIRNLEFIRQSFQLSPQSVSVSWLPSFHDMGLIDATIGAVYNGYTAVLMPSVSFIQKPLRWLKAITKYKGTHGGAPNFAFDLCVNEVSETEREGIDLSSMTTLYCGAEPIRKDTFEKFIKAYSPYGLTREAMYPCYGMAETTLIISGIEAGTGPKYLNISASAFEENKVRVLTEDTADSKYLVGVGHPWIDTRVKIVNPETLKECNESETGEIWVNGSIVTAGYWNSPESTENSFHAKLDNEETHYFRTGDLGFFHDNELYITGRLKDMIILQGKNYYPHDIEDVAEKSHTALRSCCSAAFSVEIDNSEKLVIVAEVERTAIRNLNVEEVCSAIRQKIFEEFEQSVYAIQLLRTASILKTSSGKIQRKACRTAFLNKTLEVVGESVYDIGNVSSQETVAHNQTTVLAWLMLWIHTKMNVTLDKIDVTKNLSFYGLNSLKAVQLQEDILQKYSVNIAPYLFDKLTILDLSERTISMIPLVQATK